ncbi:MAG: hypothetical protein J7502_08625 [Flavisolibacter sp.]|nr:hypothetical protein [Flavisolibacter sp.]
MKWLLFFSIVVYSCGSNSSAHLSPDQKGLFALSDNFKEDYKKTSYTVSRDKVIGNYQLKLQHYLTYTCDSSLKNMKVRMTKLEEDPSGAIHAEFRDKNCSYVFHQVYDSSRQMKADVVYRLVKSLEQGKEINLRFLYGGNVRVNDPENNSTNNFEIEVIPTAIAG